MDRIFLTILNMSLTGSFVILAIWLARVPLRNAPRIISYCLWLAAGLRLVFPFTIEGVFSLIPFRTQPIPLDIIAPAAQNPVSYTFPPVAEVINTVPYEIIPATYYEIAHQIPQLGGESVSAAQSPLALLISIAAYMWLVGAAIMLTYGVVSYFFLKRELKNSAPVLQNTAAKNIFEAKNIKSPFVLGFFSPKIYLPPGLTEDERVYIILHEQTHIRRRDHVAKFAAYLILCLHWFNPLAWLAFSLMGKDMEMSCDEWVLQKLGNDVKKSYSLSLLSFASERKLTAGSPLAFGEFGIKERVKNVLKFKQHSRIFVGLVAVLAVVFVIGFMFSRAEANDALDASELEWTHTYDAGLLTRIQGTAFGIPPNPDRDINAAIFSENAEISLQLENDPIDLQGRSIYPVRIRNHDVVYLPMEPVFAALGIEYERNANRVEIFGFQNQIVLEADKQGFASTMPFRVEWLNEIIGDTVFLQQKPSGLYVHLYLFTLPVFDLLLTPPPNTQHAGPRWTPIIFHDRDAVILVRHEVFPFYLNISWYWDMRWRIERADFPLNEAPPVAFTTITGPRGETGGEISPTVFETGSPFLISTELFDYVMLPAIETFEILGLDFSRESETVVLTIHDENGETQFAVAHDKPIFHPLETSWASNNFTRVYHEARPVIVDDILFISHADLGLILHSHQGNRAFFTDLHRQIPLLHFTSYLSAHGYSAVGDPLIVTTEQGRVVRIGDRERFSNLSLPAGVNYTAIFEFRMRAPHETQGAILFINGTIAAGNQLMQIESQENLYAVILEFFADTEITQLDLYIGDTRNIDVAGMRVDIFPS